MIPSGSVNVGVSDAGVSQPFRQVPDGAPMVAGGITGSAGGVGDALGEPGETGVTGATEVGVGDAAGEGSLPSHATIDPPNTQTNTEMSNLRKRNTPERSGTTRGYR